MVPSSYRIFRSAKHHPKFNIIARITPHMCIPLVVACNPNPLKPRNDGGNIVGAAPLDCLLNEYLRNRILGISRCNLTDHVNGFLVFHHIPQTITGDNDELSLGLGQGRFGNIRLGNNVLLQPVITQRSRHGKDAQNPLGVNKATRRLDSHALPFVIGPMVEGKPSGPGGARGTVLIDRTGQDGPGVAAVGPNDGNVGTWLGRCALHQAHDDGGTARHEVGLPTLDVGEEEGPLQPGRDGGIVVVVQLLSHVLGEVALQIIDDIPAAVTIVYGREGILVRVPPRVAWLEDDMNILHVASPGWIHLVGDGDGGVGPDQAAAWFLPIAAATAVCLRAHGARFKNDGHFPFIYFHGLLKRPAGEAN